MLIRFTAILADNIYIKKTAAKGVFTMARPRIPEELKKLHKREYMRKYKQRLKQQSFDEALKKSFVPPRPSAAGADEQDNTRKGA